MIAIAFAYGIQIFRAALLRHLQPLAQRGRKHGQPIGHHFGQHTRPLASAGHQYAQQAVFTECRKRFFAQRQYARAHGILVASTARDAGIAGVEFMRGIPGTVGGFVRMNGGAYGREVSDVLIDCDVILPGGRLVTLPAADLRYTYRHSALPDAAVVVRARFQGEPGDPATIGAKMDEIGEARENSQPLRTKTGGSTFKNPPGKKAWELVDAAGCRGLRLGGAQVSEKHTNFLLNVDNATSADIEGLGELVKRRVYEHSGVLLEWEIQRVGRP